MAFFAQSLQEQTDPRWRRDWRVLMFQLERNPENGRLWWQSHSRTKWYSSRRISMKTTTKWITARRAAQQFGVCREHPVFTAIQHNRYLTPTQAAQLAFRAGVKTDDGKRPPTWMAMDWLSEPERDIPTTERGSRIDVQRMNAELGAIDVAAAE